MSQDGGRGRYWDPHAVMGGGASSFTMQLRPFGIVGGFRAPPVYGRKLFWLAVNNPAFRAVFAFGQGICIPVPKLVVVLALLGIVVMGALLLGFGIAFRFDQCNCGSVPQLDVVVTVLGAAMALEWVIR